MKMNLTAKMMAFFMIVVLVGAIGFALVVYEADLSKKLVTSTQQEDLPRLLQTADISRDVENKFASIRGFLISGDKVSLDNFRRVSSQSEKNEKELLAIARTEQGKKLITEIIALDEKYTEIAEKVIIPLKQAGKEQEALQVMNGELTDLGRQLRAKVKEYMELRRGQIDVAMTKSVQASRNSKMAAVAAGVLSVLLGIIVGVFAARSIARPVNQLVVVAQNVAEGDLTKQVKVDRRDEIGKLAMAFNTMTVSLQGLVKQISQSAEQVAASSQELTASAEQSAEAVNHVADTVGSVAEGAERQTQEVVATASVSEQMSAGIQQVAASAGTVSGMSEKTALAAKEGKLAVDAAISQMSSIEKSVTLSAQVVAKLGDRSNEIGQIVDTISGIAGQTNLLALNAAIEAARAGEQGRGFAVVAEEVRKLAEQSQEAAKQIAELITVIQGDTESAVLAMDEGTREVMKGTEVVNTAGQSFEEIYTMINDMSSQIREVSAVMQQMASGSQQIVSSIHDIDKVSKDTASQTQTASAAIEEQAAAMEEIVTASQALSKLAEDMQAAVRRFKV